MPSYEKYQLTTVEHDNNHYGSAKHSNHRIIEERFSDISWLRFFQKKVTFAEYC